MKKLLLAAAAAMLAVSFAHAQTNAPATSPKREMRGVWISTHLSLDWPNRTQTPAQQQAALRAILDHNRATGMNAAFFQVRSQSDAMYPSSLEPWSYYLTNQQGSAPNPVWDPLQFAIEQTRTRGMEFHAWINPYRAVATVANETNPAQYAANHVSRTHPDWLLTVGTVKILNPGLPQVRDHVVNVIMDIVNRYDVDGIHFDDYFYPSGTILDDAAYNADPRGFPATTAGRADWRRDNIDMLIARVNEEIRAAKPWVKFGVSPSGIYRSSADPAVGSPTSAGASQHYSAMFADTRKWIREGWVDYLAPQVYWYIGQAGSDYQLLVPWWNDNAYERHLYIGLADYKMNTAGWTDPNQINRQIALNRANPKVLGQIHFRHAFLQADPLGYRTSLKNATYARPALLPLMGWKGSGTPGAPGQLVATGGENNAVQLAWMPAADSNDEFEKTRQYAIYRFAERETDLEAPGVLLGVSDGAAFVDAGVAPGQYHYYTVTVVNRLSAESVRTNIVSNDFEAPVVRTRDVALRLAGGTASITAADIDGGSSDNWGIASLDASRTTFSCADIGAQQVALAVTDKGGNVASGEATVRIEGHVPQPKIAALRRLGEQTGLPANTLALGYGAQGMVLSASDPASTSNSYTWNPAPGLSTGGGATASFTATSAGSFAVTVQAASPEACFAQATVTIDVVDARCGNGDKVLVCQKTGSAANPSTQVCVAPGAVPAHVKKGATVGICVAKG